MCFSFISFSLNLQIDDNLERSLGPDSESQLDTLAPEDPTAEEDIAEVCVM